MILPALAAALLCSAAAHAAPALDNAQVPSAALYIADDAPPPPPGGDEARPPRNLADMWDHKRGERGPGGGKGHREEWKAQMEKMKDMSPEEREAYKEKFMAEKRAKMEERISKLPPEKQEEARKRMAEFEAKRKQMHDELMALPPEEREARMKEMSKEFFEKNREKHTEKFKERWDKASDEDKAAFCAKAKDHCTGGDDEPYLCQQSATVCGGAE
jgi:hypothetical protein